MTKDQQKILDLTHLLMLGEFTTEDYYAVPSVELLINGYIERVTDDNNARLRVAQKGIDLIQGTSLFNKEK